MSKTLDFDADNTSDHQPVVNGSVINDINEILKTFLNICHQYSVTWRYEFNHTKSGVVTFVG